MHISQGLMHRRNQDFGLGLAKPQITYNDVIKNFQKEGILWDEELKIRSWMSGLARNQNFAKG